MKQGKNTAIAKTMRVATTFTGAAVCAAAFAPTATAATHRPAGVQGNIQAGPCSAHPTWLHVEWSTQSLECYGFSGTITFSSPIGMISQCGGNNYGWFNSKRNLPFHQGTTYRTFGGGLPYLVSKIHISHWKGSDTCPL
jgi:hypothetical protein